MLICRCAVRFSGTVSRIFRGTLDLSKARVVRSARKMRKKSSFSRMHANQCPADALRARGCGRAPCRQHGRMDADKLFYLMSRGFDERAYSNAFVVEASFASCWRCITDEKTAQSEISETIRRGDRWAGTCVNEYLRDFPSREDEMNGRPIVYLDNGASLQKAETVIRAWSLTTVHTVTQTHPRRMEPRLREDIYERARAHAVHRQRPEEVDRKECDDTEPRRRQPVVLRTSG